MEDEVEIKIEFFEIHEEDPLSHQSNLHEDVTSVEKGPNYFKVGESGNGNDYERNLDSQDASNELEEEIVCKHDFNASQSSTLNNEYYTTISEVIAEEHWYKSIDCKRRYECKFCNRFYGTLQTLRRHALSNHPTEARKLKETIANQNRKIHKCHICKVKFETLFTLEKHFKAEHFIENNHYCHKCQAVFHDKNGLSNHLEIIHNMVCNKMFMCLICGYKTHKVSHFKQHNKTHSQFKSHKCIHCNYSTYYMPNLRIHEKIHDTSYKHYKCEFTGCKYSARTKSALNSHKLKHSKGNNYIYCDRCTYKTVYRQCLKKHMDSHKRNTVKN